MKDAWAFQKHSELKPIFDFYLMKMRHAGHLDRLLFKYMSKPGGGETICPSPVVAISYNSVVSAFAALGNGFIIAGVLIFVEFVTSGTRISQVLKHRNPKQTHLRRLK